MNGSRSGIVRTAAADNAGRQLEEQSMSKVLGYRRPYFDTQPALLYPGYRSTIKRAPSKPLVLLPHTISLGRLARCRSRRHRSQRS
jgi:hypothetical protein